MNLQLTRRSLLKTLSCSLGALRCAPLLALPVGIASNEEGWTAAWDRALLESELARMDRAFDPHENMLAGRRGPEYNYQSNLRSTAVHETRESMEYASMLLYQDGEASTQRAIAIMRRVLPLQVQDPESPYFGLWSWYLEEPVDKMHSADFNWADFIGSILLNILFEHEKKLPAELAALARTALRNACASIRKRDVTLYYTNIAFQGAYVTLAAGELLRDAELCDYAKQLFVRLNATVQESGSFAEYNSPTYMAVTLENLSRILMYVRNPGSRAIATSLNALAWKQIAEHWHAPTMQMAGPMSRAYSNDIGSPMWVQKGTGNRARFLTLEQIEKKAPSGEASIPTVEFRCPEELRPLFERTVRHQEREVFIAGRVLVDNLDVTQRAVSVAPVEGTTLLTPKFSLGSANRSDFWIQRRPLIAYWGDAKRSPQCMQLRVLKDDYDFASGLFYSAQNQGCVLGCVRFRSDGGDKHPSLDKIEHGTFSLSAMRVQLLLQQWKSGNRLLVNGKAPAESQDTWPAQSRVAMDLDGVKILFQTRFAQFGGIAKSLRVQSKGADMTIDVELMRADAAQTMHWNDIDAAGCNFTLWMDDSARTLEEADAAFAAMGWKEVAKGDSREVSWKSVDGVLSVETAVRPQPVAKMDAAYEARIDGGPYPLARLEQAPAHY